MLLKTKRHSMKRVCLFICCYLFFTSYILGQSFTLQRLAEDSCKRFLGSGIIPANTSVLADRHSWDNLLGFHNERIIWIDHDSKEDLRYYCKERCLVLFFNFGILQDKLIVDIEYGHEFHYKRVSLWKRKLYHYRHSGTRKKDIFRCLYSYDIDLGLWVIQEMRVL